MPEEVQEPEPVSVRRGVDGRIPAPIRYIQYDGQAIVRTPGVTHQSWTSEGTAEPVFPLSEREFRPKAAECGDLQNPDLGSNQFSVYYIESDDEDPVLYEVVDRGD